MESQDRRYIHKIGANADFGIDDVDFDSLSNAKIIYIGGYLGLPKFNQDSLISLLKFAREKGIKTVLDIIMPGEGDWMGWCKDALQYVDAFMPNNDEAKGLTGENDPVRQAESIMKYGPNMVVITMGGEGALLMTKNEIVRSSSYKVNFVDASGGGDAFAAGSITGMLNNLDLRDTIKLASAIGASCVRKLGCRAGLFSREEADEFIKNNEIKLEVEKI